MKSTSKKIPNSHIKGLLLVNKSVGATSFSLVKILRKLTNVAKVGHAGTLDPFASGVMILLIGKEYTQKANELITLDKEYLANIKLGSSTNTFDTEGNITNTSEYIPTNTEVQKVIDNFQNEIKQVPPMFSAKKINGQKLYNLARKGITVERVAQTVTVETTLLSYEYPNITVKIKCSKGTYIRSIANDMGTMLNTYGHLNALTRLRIGPFQLKDCLDQKDLEITTVERFLRDL